MDEVLRERPERLPEGEKSPDPAIASIQGDMREQVFDTVIERNGALPGAYQRHDDLRSQPNPEIPAIKEGAIKGREVVLEERRLVEMLRDSFQDMLDHPEQLQGDVRAMLLHELPSLIALLNGPREQLFRSGLDIGTYLQDLQKHLGEIRGALEGVTVSEMTRNIIRTEVEVALHILEDTRKRPVLAHRARGFGKDEASAEGFREVLQQDVAEVEFDIRMSKDHQPIIHHNATLGASAGRPEWIKDLTRDELAQVTLKGGDHITDLRGFFELLRETKNEGTKINIDIKDFDRQMLDEILSLIRENKLEHRVVLVSWFPQALQYLYEKDPSLSYSLSYYPILRGISRWILNHIQQKYGNPAVDIPGLNFLASRVAAARANAAQEGNPKVQGLGSELITNAMVLDANTHWTDIEAYAQESGKPLVGVHTFAGGPAPAEGTLIARVLQNGSVNVMACEEMLVSAIGRLPLPPKAREWLLNLFRRKEAIIAFAAECQKQGIKVNLFDLKNQENLEAHETRFEEAGIQPGPVYSSNPDLAPRLKTKKRKGEAQSGTTKSAAA